jgi:molybdopterin synthase sulfur carrier subunit
MVRISIPPTLRKLCSGEDAVLVRPGTLSDALNQLQERFHGIQERLCDENGEIRGSVLIIVNDEDVRFLAAKQTPLKSGDEVAIIPAFAGG